jgi:hypothetical protein
MIDTLPDECHSLIWFSLTVDGTADEANGDDRLRKLTLQAEDWCEADANSPESRAALEAFCRLQMEQAAAGELLPGSIFDFLKFETQIKKFFVEQGKRREELGI